MICLQREWQPGLSTPPCPIPDGLEGVGGGDRAAKGSERAAERLRGAERQSMLTAPTAPRQPGRLENRNPTTADHPERTEDQTVITKRTGWSANAVPGRETQTPITPGSCLEAQIQTSGCASSLSLHLHSCSTSASNRILPSLSSRTPAFPLSQSLPTSWS